MGNTASTTMTTTKPPDPTNDDCFEEAQQQFRIDDEAPWPANLYLEARDMMAVSFLVYSFAYILETARRERTNFEGLDLDQDTFAIRKCHESNLDLARSFTPTEVLELIASNAPLLTKHFGREFGETATTVMDSLRLLQDREQAAPPRALTLEEFDDHHSKHELVYAIAVDRVNKRVTLVFRGTENELSFSSNWSTNLTVGKTQGKVPDYFQKTTISQIHYHRGFYNYLFRTTMNRANDPTFHKYDEVVDDVLRVLSAQPAGYKLYVTGHSLGGALAILASFFMATDDRFPTPITCITAGQPRVGDYQFLRAVQMLEQDSKLRYCRLVNNRDIVPLVPLYGFYHAGFQVRLPLVHEKQSTMIPEITYPVLEDSWQNRWSRTWDNSILTNIDLRYNHGDYRERVEAHRTELEKWNLNHLYASPDLTGWAVKE